MSFCLCGCPQEDHDYGNGRCKHKCIPDGPSTTMSLDWLQSAPLIPGQRLPAKRVIPRGECGSCRFYDPGEGECRRRAPTTDAFPLVAADDWCGEFEAKP